MGSFSSFLKREMKQEFAVLSQTFEENQKAYEKELRRFLLKHIDECLRIDEDLSHDMSFTKLRYLLLKTKIFQGSHVDPDFESTSNFQQLERLANWLLDPDSDSDYEVDTLKITKEVFDKTPVSVKAFLFDQLEYNLDVYVDVHDAEQDKTSIYLMKELFE